MTWLRSDPTRPSHRNLYYRGRIGCLADPAGQATAELARPCGADCGPRPIGGPPAVGHRAGNSGSDRTAGVGCPGRGVSAPGWGLRRDLCREHRRQNSRQGENAAADGGRAHLWGKRAGGEGRPDSRPVCQAAVSRHRGEHGAAVLPRRCGQRHRRDGGGPPARPRPAGGRLPCQRGRAEPRPVLRHRWVR